MRDRALKVVLVLFIFALPLVLIGFAFAESEAQRQETGVQASRVRCDRIKEEHHCTEERGRCRAAFLRELKANRSFESAETQSRFFYKNEKPGAVGRPGQLDGHPHLTAV